MKPWFINRSSGPEPEEAWEARLRRTAQAFPYPAAPGLAGAVRQRLVQASRLKSSRRLEISRRLTWGILLILLILGSLLAIPRVRAALVEFLQVGTIRIFLVEPTSTLTPLPQTPTALPSPTPLSSLLDLAGQTTLAEAQQRSGFQIRLPAYPAEMGAPDEVFLQELGGPVVVLVWLEPDRPEQVRLSLHQLGPDTFAQKGLPQLIEETRVNGQPAIWTGGPYLLQFRRGSGAEPDLRRLVAGHTLVWQEGEITYRLETDLPLAEAVKIAESLH
jgi:hypothetical protein